MPEEFLTVKEMIAATTADIDQVQASIDNARSRFKNDRNFQLIMDQKQFDVDAKRERIKILSYIDSVINP